jgi:hypothetical protein
MHYPKSFGCLKVVRIRSARSSSWIHGHRISNPARSAYRITHGRIVSQVRCGIDFKLTKNRDQLPEATESTIDGKEFLDGVNVKDREVTM